MLQHYLLVAFRNLWKYRLQSIICIGGLAVGFTCFALAVLWIRYETTFDTSHKDAENLYVLKMEDTSGKAVSNTVKPLSDYINNFFPEVEFVSSIRYGGGNLFYGKEESKKFVMVNGYMVDHNYIDIFDIQVLLGNLDFLNPGLNQMAITERIATEMFGNSNPLGEKVILYNEEYTIGAVVKGLEGRSNFSMDVLYTCDDPERYSQWINLIKTRSGINIKTLKNKLLNYELEDFSYYRHFYLVPISSYRYDPDIRWRGLTSFTQITVFAFLGLLVVVCSLFNYLTLFVSRFQLRRKEVALRMVCGSSIYSLFILFGSEFLLTLLISFMFGLALIHLFYPYFVKLSYVQLKLPEIYSELLLYIGVVCFLSLVLFIFVLIFFRRSNLIKSLGRKRKGVFLNLMVILQLTISIGFIFCTFVVIRQVHFLKNIDAGLDYKNTAGLYLRENMDRILIESWLNTIPEITDFGSDFFILFPKSSSIQISLQDWEGFENYSSENVPKAEIFPGYEDYIDFYGFRLAEGDKLLESDNQEYILVNEELCRMLGWKNGVGKFIIDDAGNNMIVKGVVKDFFLRQKEFPYPTIFAKRIHPAQKGQLLFRYKEGMWNEVKTKLEVLLKEEYPDLSPNLLNAEESYIDRLDLAKEDGLLKILTFCSLACIIMSVFGFYSMVSLACEEQRKEIAIRKVNGATVKKIISVYFTRYFLLLLFSSLIAFPTGNLIIKYWMEQYGRQAETGTEVYAFIFLGLLSVIIIAVGSIVYRTSNENPANVLKSE